MTETVKQTIKREGRTVTLITDGRTLTKTYNTETEAKTIYAKYKAMIEAATPQ